MAHIKAAKPKQKVVIHYSAEGIKIMLAVCDYDFQHNAKFLFSRNQPMILTLLDSGVRLSELAGITLNDIDTEKGWLEIRGKGNKESTYFSLKKFPFFRFIHWLILMSLITLSYLTELRLFLSIMLRFSYLKPFLNCIVTTLCSQNKQKLPKISLH